MTEDIVIPISQAYQAVPESQPLTDEEKAFLRKLFADAEADKEILYNIYERSDQGGMIFWVLTFLVMIVSSIIGFAALYGAFKPSPVDPKPCYVLENASAFEPGYRYEFFNTSVSYNESRRLCTSRNGELITFNNTKEQNHFNEFVEFTFKGHVTNFTEPFRRRGLQIWTGYVAYFRANKKIKVEPADWPLSIHMNQTTKEFLKESQEKRICLLTTKEANARLLKALSSKNGVVHSIVKDFTGKFRNLKSEVGCWNVRFVDPDQTLLLPFVCKSRQKLEALR
jgi:hypothetical protein